MILQNMQAAELDCAIVELVFVEFLVNSFEIRSGKGGVVVNRFKACDVVAELRKSPAEATTAAGEPRFAA